MTLFDDLYVINKKDVKNSSRVLANAFSEDPIMKAMNLDREDIKRSYEITIRFCLRYGNVFAASKNLEGIIAFCPGKYGNMGIWNIIRSGAIIPALKVRKHYKSMEGMIKILQEDKKNLNIGPYIYLFVLGVSRVSQGKGFGGKMLRALIEKSKKEGNPIYLETESEENVSLYKKFGFETLKKITLPELNLPMWEMVR